MEERAHRLALTIQRLRDAWLVELSHVDPRSEARVAPVRGPAALDGAALLALQATPEAYGRALMAQLLSDPALLERFLQVEVAARVAEAPLRLSLRVDPTAQELHALRWELLRHPRTGALLATSEATPLSRFMVSRDWRPVKLRPKADLRVLVAVANPGGERAARLRLAPIDVAAELASATAALAGLRLRTLDAPCTHDRLLAALRDGVDLLYLVAHGTFNSRTGEPCLLLQGEDGDVERVGGDALAARVAELITPPRLVVLASCQSAGDGTPESGTTAQATLAWRLGDAGVPAVVAMQGSISMATAGQLLPAFFRELQRDGQLDRAMAVARGLVRDRHDAWMPALYTRLEDCRLWYTPGFRGARTDEVWRALVPAVQAGRVLPILGPGLLEPVHGSSWDLARRIAEQKGFPLPQHDWDDLPRVQQYLGVKESRFNVLSACKDQMLQQLVERHRSWLPAAALANPSLPQLLRLVADRLREDPSDTWRLLAGLRAPIFLTTTFDPLLGLALKAAGKAPQQVLPRWRHGRAPRSADEQPVPPASVDAPLVYHAFGAFGKDTDDTLVLTEDNHFDYLIDTASYKLTPPEVAAALVDSSLLFLGFRLTDWSFRVLFRLMMSLPNRNRLKDYCHVAVQLDPELWSMADIEGARRYLAEYLGKEANIDIFWGSPQEFLQALGGELSRTATAAPPAHEDDDEWAF